MPAPKSRAFTLVELLMVIGIITILIVLGISLARRVTGTGKKALTEQTLRVLDTTLNAYIAAKGSNPPAWIVDPRLNNPNNQYILPVADARNFAGADPANSVINSVGLFMLQCQDVPEAAAVLKNLDARSVRDFTPDPTGSANWLLQPKLSTAIDGWGNPIRYVHPTFHGLVVNNSDRTQPVQTSMVLPLPTGKRYGIDQIRRNNSAVTPIPSGGDPDSDGGVSTGARPYFYSLGPDGKAGYEVDTTGKVINDFNADNVYLTAPRFQKSN